MVLFVTGLLVTNLIGRRLVAYWEGVLQRIPLVRSVYGGVKGFTESVFSQDNTFRKVVMIQYPRLGHVDHRVRHLGQHARDQREDRQAAVCVYVPTTPNPTSGFIVMVPQRGGGRAQMSVDAAMKMIITCGVVVPQN